MFLIALITLIALCGCSEPKLTKPPPDSDVIRIQRGTFVSGAEDVGIIQATQSASVTAEVDGKIARMLPEGTRVTEGMPVLWMDDQEIRKSIDTEKINLKRHKSDLERARESLSESRFNLEQTLKERTAGHKFDQLNVQRAERELDRLRDRFSRKLIPESEVLNAEADLRQKQLKENSSRLSLERAQTQFDSKMKSMQTELAIAQQQYERSQFHMASLKSRHEKMVLKAPAAGIIVIKENWRKEHFKVGDRLWTGVQVIEIPDLSSFQVWTQVAESHLNRVKLDQNVAIRVPALDNLPLNGSVKSISWLAMPRVLSRGTGYTSDDSTEGGQVFEILVSLETSDQHLKPGMNVAVVFVEEQMENVLIAPVSAVAHSSGKPYVFKFNDGDFSPETIETGSSNRSDIIVTEGLKEGQRIALFNPGRRL